MIGPTVRSGAIVNDVPDAADDLPAGYTDVEELGRLPARLLVYGVEGQDFELGAPLSRAVARSVDALALELSEL